MAKLTTAEYNQWKSECKKWRKLSHKVLAWSFAGLVVAIVGLILGDILLSVVGFFGNLVAFLISVIYTGPNYRKAIRSIYG